MSNRTARIVSNTKAKGTSVSFFALVTHRAHGSWPESFCCSYAAHSLEAAIRSVARFNDSRHTIKVLREVRQVVPSGTHYTTASKELVWRNDGGAL